VESVRLTNVPSFLLGRGYEVDVEGLGRLKVDVAYGGNFYAIVEPQAGYRRPRRPSTLGDPLLGAWSCARRSTSATSSIPRTRRIRA
jgi:hypothetical protein